MFGSLVITGYKCVSNRTQLVLTDFFWVGANRVKQWVWGKFAFLKIQLIIAKRQSILFYTL